MSLKDEDIQPMLEEAGKAALSVLQAYVERRCEAAHKAGYKSGAEDRDQFSDWLNFIEGYK